MKLPRKSSKDENNDIINAKNTGAECYADKRNNKIHKANMFLSTSLSRQYEEEFGMNAGKGIMLEIKVPKGTKSIYIGGNSSYQNEFELLLSSETSYKITYRDERTIKMELVHEKPRKS